MNDIGRDMPFYNIALNYRGMTRIELLGHVVLDLDINELITGHVLLFDSKTIRLQVPDPR